MHATEAKPWRRQVTAGGRPAPRVRRTGDEADRLKALGPASRADGLLGRLSSSSFSPLVEHVHITLAPGPQPSLQQPCIRPLGIYEPIGTRRRRRSQQCVTARRQLSRRRLRSQKIFRTCSHYIRQPHKTRAHAGFGCRLAAGYAAPAASTLFYNANCRWHEESVLW